MVADPPVMLMSRSAVVPVNGDEIELPRKAKVRISQGVVKNALAVLCTLLLSILIGYI